MKITKLNKLLCILLLVTYIIVNILMILYYCREYMPYYYHNTKCRCIQNFVEKNKILFLMIKYRYICLFMAYNFTMISLFVIIYCV